MFFAIITFITAFLMEGIGSYISIVGLNSIFAGDYVIMAMAVILDIAKIVTVSFLYKTWYDKHAVMKIYRTYMIGAVAILMTITSVGAFGYLSSAFQKAIQPNQQITTKLDMFNTEKTRLEKEREQLTSSKQKIENQIANLPQDYVNSRTRLINSFKEESKVINNRMATIDTRLTKLNDDVLGLKGSQIESNAHVGPIVYVSSAFGISMEEAVKWVILVIIFVFDPLAIMLVLAGNYLYFHRKEIVIIPGQDVIEEPSTTEPPKSHKKQKAKKQVEPIVENVIEPSKTEIVKAGPISVEISNPTSTEIVTPQVEPEGKKNIGGLTFGDEKKKIVILEHEPLNPNASIIDENWHPISDIKNYYSSR